MAIWADFRKRASSWLAFGSSPGERAEDIIFYRQWLTDHGQRIVHNFVRILILPELLGAIVSPMINTPPFGWMGCVILGALSIQSLLWIVFEHRIRKEHMRRALRVYSWTSTMLVTSGIVMYVYGAFFNKQFPPGIVLVAGMIWGSAAWTIGLTTPVLGLGSMLLTLMVSVSTVSTLYALNAPGFAKLGWLFVIVDLTIAYFFKQKFDQLKAYALLYKRNAELENQLQVLSLNAVEHELKLASAVQGKLAAVQTQDLKGEGFEIRLFNEPYGALGGDILLTRTMTDGTLVIVVGDVTGKGAPAGMVVQAVLSLWALQQKNDEFSVAKWMELVNSTLMRMGREPGLNTLTMGALSIGRDKAQYYRAGHIPLYVQHKKKGISRIKQFTGTGMPLGLVDNPSINPVSVDLREVGGCTLWLGTDGIFDWGTRRSSSLVRLIDTIDRDGVIAVKSHPVADDKILVALHVGVAAQRAL